MEKEVLIARIEAFDIVWKEAERLSPGGYEHLMNTEDGTNLGAHDEREI